METMKWRVLLEQDEETGEWAAWCPELPGCASAGETEAEALENIREAIELYLQPDPLDLSPDRKTRRLASRMNESTLEIITDAAESMTGQRFSALYDAKMPLHVRN